MNAKQVANIAALALLMASGTKTVAAQTNAQANECEGYMHTIRANDKLYDIRSKSWHIKIGRRSFSLTGGYAPSYIRRACVRLTCNGTFDEFDWGVAKYGPGSRFVEVGYPEFEACKIESVSFDAIKLEPIWDLPIEDW